MSQATTSLAIVKNMAEFFAYEYAGAKLASGVRALFSTKSAVSTSLVAPFPANPALPGTAEQMFLYPGQTIDRFGGLGGKWFSTPGTSFGARTIRPGSSPYTQFDVLKPFEVQRSLASPGMFNGQVGFGVQFRSPVSAKSF